MIQSVLESSCTPEPLKMKVVTLKQRQNNTSQKTWILTTWAVIIKITFT